MTPRELDFADSFESSAAPTAGFTTASAIKSFASDAAFVTAKGSAAAAGDIYHNTVSNQIKEYNGSTWREVVASEGAQTIAGDKTFSNNVIVTGDLTVNGTTTTINTATLDVEDAQITVNKGGTQATANAQDSGLLVEMSDATDVMIGYDSALASRWKAGDVGSEAQIATVSHTQVLTEKDIDGGVASDTRRITLPSANTATLNALTRKAGTLVYNTTTSKPMFDDGATLQEIGAGGGGAGGGLRWYEPDSMSGIKSVLSNGLEIYAFTDTDDLSIFCKVTLPESYEAGSQVFFKYGKAFSSVNTGNFLFRSTSYIFKAGVDATSIPTGYASTNTQQAINGTANLITSISDLDLSDVDGEIDSIALSAGDTILVKLTRLASSETSGVVGDVNLIIDSFGLDITE